MRKFAVGLAAACLMAACGGTESAPVCAPSGSWSIVDTRTSSSGGLCAGPDTATGTIAVQLTVDSAAGTFTWIEGGISFAGTINLGTCAGTVTAGNTQAITDENGSAATLTASVSRSVAFNGNSMSGTTTTQLSTSGVVTGVPCSWASTAVGTRH